MIIHHTFEKVKRGGRVKSISNLEKIEEDNRLKIDYEDCMQLFLAHKHIKSNYHLFYI